MLTLDEERRLNQPNGQLAGVLARLTDKRILEWQQVTDGAENLKHLVSEEVWRLFFLSRAFWLRIANVLIRESKKKPMMSWREDQGIHDLLSQILPKNEVEKCLAPDIGALTFVRQSLEAKLIKTLRKESEKIARVSSQALAETELEVALTTSLYRVAGDISEPHFTVTAGNRTQVEFELRSFGLDLVGTGKQVAMVGGGMHDTRLPCLLPYRRSASVSGSYRDIAKSLSAAGIASPVVIRGKVRDSLGDAFYSQEQSWDFSEWL